MRTGHLIGGAIFTAIVVALIFRISAVRTLVTGS